MVLTVRSALAATSELGTPTPKVFSILTTSSRASMESSPKPPGPKSGRSSPISSGVVCSIRLFTSISLMRVRRSGSDMKVKWISGGNARGRVAGCEPRLCRNVRATSNAGGTGSVPSSRKYHAFGRHGGRLSRSNPIRPVGIWRGRLIGTGLACARRRSGRRVLDLRNGRRRRATVRLGRVGLVSGMARVAEFVFRFLKFLDRRAHAAGQFRQFLRAEENKNDQEDDDQVGSAEIPQESEQAHRSKH